MYKANTTFINLYLHSCDEETDFAGIKYISYAANWENVTSRRKKEREKEKEKKERIINCKLEQSIDLTSRLNLSFQPITQKPIM